MSCQASLRLFRVGWPVFSLAMILLAFKHPAAAQKAPLTVKDIIPVVKRCFQCHGEALQMSGLDLHTRAGMLKGGAGGPAIVAGNSSASLLMKRVTGEVKPLMPMAPVPALTPQEIATLKDWIDQGAHWDSDAAPAPAPTVTASTPGYKEKEFSAEDRSWWAFQKPVRQPAPTGHRCALESERHRRLRARSDGEKGIGSRASGRPQNFDPPRLSGFDGVCCLRSPRWRPSSKIRRPMPMKS